MARFVVLVIDSFGVGAMKDVTLVRPQDAGANTCGHILSQLPHLQLPTLEKLGLINALGYAPGDMQPSDSATWGVAELQHEGGDTHYAYNFFSCMLFFSVIYLNYLSFKMLYLIHAVINKIRFLNISLNFCNIFNLFIHYRRNHLC